MKASYDEYNYPTYWEKRYYEHKSEVIAIKSLLNEIPNITTIGDLGGGYGRLVNTYSQRAKNIYLIDPSSKLLSKAKKDLFYLENIKFIQSSVENLIYKNLKAKFDTILFVRVMHHIKDIDKVFSILSSLLKNNGYLILEFANKNHWKAIFKKFIRGDFTFPVDIFPIDRRSTRSKKKKAITFLNYHPDLVEKKLIDNGFSVIDKLSVSNLRNNILKNHLSSKFLINIEKHIQKPFAKINFGPSIFILAKNVQ